ncbi:MAG: DUF167 domain-containing protein [Candidatus Buchananbacteria bacterium]|nr:DUF167 domain-containing protein [Candidatus Buchananbacteria bacterium]
MPKTITVKVTPRSSKTEIIEESDTFLKIKLKSSPLKGEANTELIKFLSKHYKIGKSQIEIVKGLTSREKLIRILQ